MIARDIMTRRVITVRPDASAQEAAQLLDPLELGMGALRHRPVSYILPHLTRDQQSLI
jgi:CBS domain-containing protein